MYLHAFSHPEDSPGGNASVVAGAQSRRLGRLDHVRVLIVDDDPGVNEALMALFDSCGAHAQCATTVREAILLFDRWNPDVLVSDITMPGEDGYALIQTIRSRPAEWGGAVPAVALTALTDVGDRASILAAGFQMYLSKPAEPCELVAVVGNLVVSHPSKGGNACC